LLDRHYPASSLIRASPSPHTARPVSHETPVDRIRDHRWGFPCCSWSTLPACRRHYPGRSDGTRSLVLFHQRRPAHKTRGEGSCVNRFGRVEDWRASVGRSLCSLFLALSVCECHIISTLPRLQPPPHRTQRADFLALRSPVRFSPRVMRPVQLRWLSARSIGLGSHQTAPESRIATAYSTAPSRTLGVSVLASHGAEPSWPPSP
jgi:hypothetical protein